MILEILINYCALWLDFTSQYLNVGMIYERFFK